jgi:hypothetical protein
MWHNGRPAFGRKTPARCAGLIPCCGTQHGISFCLAPQQNGGWGSDRFATLAAPDFVGYPEGREASV